MKSLVKFLAEEYGRCLSEQNARLAKAGDPQLDVDEQLGRTADFVDFCEDYLDRNRPQRIASADANYRLALPDGREALVCPEFVPVAGSMQPCVSVPVTGHQTLREITGQAPAPGGVTAPPQDLSGGSAAVDYRLPRPTRRLDRP